MLFGRGSPRPASTQSPPASTLFEGEEARQLITAGPVKRVRVGNAL